MAEKHAISRLYLNLRQRLARSVSNMVPPHEVEDIVQETYVRVCQVKRPDAIRQPHSFLLKIAHNLALDYLKRADTRLTDPLDNQIEELDPETDHTLQRVASDQEFARFCEAVRQLPQQCRRVFVLKKVYGYSQREIADQLHLSQSTVEKHIATGMLRCAEYLAPMDSQESSPARAETNL